MVVRVDQVLDLARAELVDCRLDPRLRDRDPGVNHELAFLAGQHDDVPARPHQYAEATAQRRDGDLALGGRLVDGEDGIRLCLRAGRRSGQAQGRCDGPCEQCMKDETLMRDEGHDVLPRID
jgi:hypothetical protein